MEKPPPFTKRALKNLCGKINREQSEDDVRKTMEVFAELGSRDPHFTYRVQADEDGRIATLMWANGSSRLQYTFFEDVVTFDTTYRTNLYNMPFGLFVGVIIISSASSYLGFWSVVRRLRHLSGFSQNLLG